MGLTCRGGRYHLLAGAGRLPAAVPALLFGPAALLAGTPGIRCLRGVYQRTSVPCAVAVISK